MSTEFMTSKNVHINEYKKIDDLVVSSKCFTNNDGDDYECKYFSYVDFDEGRIIAIHYYEDEDGYVYGLKRYGNNNPEKIIDLIEQALNIKVWNEYEYTNVDYMNRTYGVNWIESKSSDGTIYVDNA